jgi:4,5:9,10-diseco-3-hydroxy-5,9,17-trioxoandrosta-1(10),2-diene-4-oate hydrolase
MSATAWNSTPPSPPWHGFERQIELPSGKTCFAEAGEGFPLVLLHGLMANSFSWRKNIPALARHFRVLALDSAGSGHSGVLSHGVYGVEAWSRQVEEFLDLLGLSAVHLLAASAGGAVALDFAARCGDRVARLALVSPVNPFSRRIVRLAKVYAWTGLPDFLLSPLVARAPRLLPWIFRHRFYSNPARITPETIPGYLEGLRVQVTVPMLRQAICGWSPARMKSDLSRVKAPALLLWGEEDKVVPPACIPALASALPSATVVTIPGAGHLCYEELPEVFNEHVLSFLGKAPEAL